MITDDFDRHQLKREGLMVARGSPARGFNQDYKLITFDTLSLSPYFERGH